jgi:hypothetical protein
LGRRLAIAVIAIATGTYFDKVCPPPGIRLAAPPHLAGQ